MKKNLLAIILILSSIISLGQSGKFPYPIIFLHGLSSSDTTWTTAVNYLGGNAKVFDVCLNDDGNNSIASLTNDISIIGWRDANNTPSPNRLYIMNFDNARFSTSGHDAHTLSNQAAIYKQGIALKAMIDSVLAIENTDKVILVGHSMGGLEIREYLQRGYDGTINGRGTNWVDQTSPFGHRVAKVITLGTPHLGSNYTSGGQLNIPGVDENSEAVRDLRYNQTMPFPLTSFYGIYIFGGSESSIPSSYYNKDINCNGSSADNITGISSGTTYNSSMPLPLNIPYCWITSDYYGSGKGDGLVEFGRQWLYSGSTPTPSSITDTLMMNVNHLNEPNDYFTIIRGLDEPADTSLAFFITEDQNIKGYITYNTNWNSSDVDRFRLVPKSNGSYQLSLTGTNSGVTLFKIYDNVGELGTSSGTGIITANNLTKGKTYYIEIDGTANSTTYQNPYTLSASKVVPVELTSFTGQVNGKSVQLNWVTATELNNYGFEIQRQITNDVIGHSSSANCNWNNIGFVKGYGSSTKPNHYFFIDVKPNGGSKIIYRLKQIDMDGSFNFTNEIEVNEAPSEFELFQNYPNPFNPATKIKYQIPASLNPSKGGTLVSLKVYDILGKNVATLVNEQKEPGFYEVEFNAMGLTSGLYFYQLTVDNNVISTKKMMVMK